MKPTFLLLGALLLSTATGCAKLHVTYAPSSAAAAASTGLAVQVKVADTRPADNGGSDKKVVGQVRNTVGIPNDLSDADPTVVTRTVTEATTDALKHAGVGVGGSGKILVATVKEFWMDGYMGYKGSITVDYALKDAEGKTVWTATITGADGGSNVMRSAFSMTEEIFQKALTEVAANATKAFQTPEFLAAAK